MNVASRRPILAYVEHCLPADDLAGRLRLARRHALALEVANRPGVPLEDIGKSVRLVALQAYRMHDFHPLHADPRHRCEAAVHLQDTLDKAARLGIPRVIAICGYGAELIDHPFERTKEFFAAMIPRARDLGVHVLIEPLSRLRAAAMTGAGDIQRLLGELDAPDVFASVLDTGHIQDDGHDPGVYFEAWRHPVEEVQLRGAGSRPPAADVPLRRWLGALSGAPAVVSVEHRRPISLGALEPLVKHLRAELSSFT